MVAGELPPPPIAVTLDFDLVEVEAGRAVFEGVPAEFDYNPIGVVHAGYTVTLLDSAMGCAFVSTAEPGTSWTTLELKANFTRPLTADTGLVRCTGSVIHPGRTIVTTEALPAAPAGRHYEAWARHADGWTRLGNIEPDTEGSARLIASLPTAMKRVASPPRR